MNCRPAPRALCLFASLGLLTGLTLGGAAASELDAFVDSVRHSELGNGMTLLYRHQPDSGVVAINTYVKAGYFHEPDEVAGMAHLFEHMFFKGSEKFPEPEQISTELARVGGRSNAGTIYTTTTYYFVLPAEGFRRAMEIQADALIHPLFDPEELAKEAEVVIEESNRKLDRPSAVSLERMLATAFEHHRIRRWRIGSNEVLRNIDRADLLAFFDTLYRPENIILTIVGDVPYEQVAATAEETFGQLERGTLAKHRGPQEPPQTGLRYGQSSADISQGYSVMGWHTPEQGHPDELALDVLSRILGSGRASRLYRGVVGPEGAATSRAMHWVFEDVGMLMTQSSFDEEKRLEVERRVLAEVERMKAHGPTPYELALAKNGIEAESVFQLEDVLGQAQSLSYHEARGGFRRLSDQLDELATLTPERIHEVARRYLTTDNLTVYDYRPEGTPEVTLEQVRARVTAATVTAPAPPEPIAAPVLPPSIAAASRATPVESRTLSNGVTLIVEARPGAPLVSARVDLAGGRRFETSGNAGITRLMSGSMLRGTESRSAQEIDRQIEFLGTQIGTSLQADHFGFTLDILTKNFAAGLDLLADVVLRPTFPESEVEEQKHLQLAAIKRSLDSSTSRPFQLLAGQLYGNHPYALPPEGYPTSLAVMTPASLKSWWRARVQAEATTITVVGDVDPQAVTEAIEAAFASLPRRIEPPKEVAAPVPPPARLEVVEHRRRRQSAITVAFPTVSPDHEDWPALRLLQNVTSGLAGTFFAELRGRQSLAYTVFAFDQSEDQAGAFIAYLATEASKEPEAKAALLAEFAKLPGEGITDDDAARARSYYSGSTRISMQSNARRAGTWARDQILGLGLDFTSRTLDRVAALGTEDLRAVAKKYLSHDRWVSATLRGESQEP